MLVTGHSIDKVALPGQSQSTAAIVKLQGQLRQAPEKIYRSMRKSVETVGYTAFLKELKPTADQPIQHEVTAVPGVIPKLSQNVRVSVFLFLATLAAVFFVGGVGVDGFNIGNGLMYAATLMGILVAHEAGHYIVGKWRGAPVSLPYFIPFPFNFGTLGAVMVQNEPFEDRRTMLEIGIAGPLAGLVVAVPLYMLGLTLSEIKPLPPTGEYVTLGESLLTQFIGVLQFGWIDISLGYDVFVHPIAMGAWIGLLITGINLIPAGQLDGGHIAAAIFGAKAKYISYAMVGLMLGLSLISSTWLLWAVLLALFARTHPPALNEATKLDVFHFGLSIIALLVLCLVFVPRPMY
jgi:membrane-associated protease RseP (regulator of RpoE activity)